VTSPATFPALRAKIRGSAALRMLGCQRPNQRAQARGSRGPEVTPGSRLSVEGRGVASQHSPSYADLRIPGAEL
jgi:hypothetical protein